MTPRNLAYGFVLVGVFGAQPANAARIDLRPFAFTCNAFAHVTKPDLIARYGEAQVVDTQIFGRDDPAQMGTVVFPDVSDSRLEIMWDTPSQLAPRWIKVAGTRWRTSQGIAVGMSLRALERANGGPFRIAGFFTEAAGLVQSWGVGRMASRPDADGCEIRIQFQPAASSPSDDRLIRSVRSGLEYSSGHPALQQLNPRVVAMWLEWHKSAG